MTDDEILKIADLQVGESKTFEEWALSFACAIRQAQPEPYPENFIDALRFDAAQSEPVIYARKEGDLIVADLPQVPRGSGGIIKDEQPEPEPVAWVYPDGFEALQNRKCWTVYGTH